MYDMTDGDYVYGEWSYDDLNYWFQSSAQYCSVYMDDDRITDMWGYGMTAQRFIPKWQQGYSVGDTVWLWTSFYSSGTNDYSTQNVDLVLAGASQLAATTLAAVTIAAAL